MKDHSSERIKVSQLNGVINTRCLGWCLPRSPDHEGSEYVLTFEIGQREGGFYSARTDRQTDRPTQ